MTEWALTRGECEPWLASRPDKSASAILTDPPYERQTHAGARYLLAQGLTDKRISFPPITEAQRAQWAREFVRLSRGWILVFSQIEGAGAWEEALVKAGASRRGTAIWHKTNPGPQVTGDRPRNACEALVMGWAGKGRSRWNGRGKQGFWEYPTERKAQGRFHETQKPLSLCSRLIDLFTQPGDLVLDPFAGSAAIGAACLRAGRSYAGCERDPHYYQQALARLESEDDRARNPPPPPAPPRPRAPRAPRPSQSSPPL